MKDLIAIVVIFGAILGASLVFKNWQCSELFPDANRFACVFWK